MVPIPRPTVDLRLAREHYQFQVVALVDTGAPVTLFDSAVAEPLVRRG
jgi:hypothetical protein